MTIEPTGKTVPPRLPIAYRQIFHEACDSLKMTPGELSEALIRRYLPRLIGDIRLEAGGEIVTRERVQAWAIENSINWQRNQAGRVIRGYRQAMGWSRRDLARKCNMKPSQIQKMEQGLKASYANCWRLSGYLADPIFDEMLETLEEW
jgi:hypothetical protein